MNKTDAIGALHGSPCKKRKQIHERSLKKGGDDGAKTKGLRYLFHINPNR
jgi:hypothetical protein